VTDDKPRLSRLASWWQRRRLRKAARLLKRGTISQLDYSLVAADVISRFYRARPIESQDRLHIVTFDMDGLVALGERVNDWETLKDRQYGPLGIVPDILVKRFPVFQGGAGDYTDRGNWEFVWGDQCADLLWRSQRRLRLWGRLVQRYDLWRTRQKEFAPAAYEDLWRALIAILGLAVGFVLRGLV
jgi:hypothetical protein